MVLIRDGVYSKTMSDEQRNNRIDVSTFLRLATENVSEEIPQNESGEYRRRIALPVVLFIATCLSTFFVACCQWSPDRVIMVSFSEIEADMTLVRRMIMANWVQGVTFTTCLMLILFAHEMGHFVGTIIYKIPASLPYFLPFPFSPLGTFGAVIAMQPGRANRKEIFDVGIAGPLAGLVVAIPILLIGVTQLDLTSHPSTGFGFESPMLIRWLMLWFEIKGAADQEYVVWCNQLNPFFMAAWFGLIMTAINMFPIGQLDGGHTTYALFGKAAHWIARATLVLAIAFITYLQTPTLAVMICLLLLIGPDHPETTDDSVELGWARKIIGYSSLAIPILCFPPLIFRMI